MNPEMLAMIKAKRTKAGLKVIDLDNGWEGYFASVESRDEFIERARRQGHNVKVA